MLFTCFSDAAEVLHSMFARMLSHILLKNFTHTETLLAVGEDLCPALRAITVSILYHANAYGETGLLLFLFF